MIDIYRMNPEQALQMVKALARQVHWDRWELLRLIRDWAGSYTGRMKHKKIHQMKLEELLAEIRGIADGAYVNTLFWHLVGIAPFHVKLDPKDDDPGFVMVYAESKIMAVHDQSICGSRWEAPDDLDCAYACVTDEPDLVRNLVEEGYIVNTDDYGCYDPPRCPHDNPLGECTACDVAGDLAFDADREDRCK